MLIVRRTSKFPNFLRPLNAMIFAAFALAAISLSAIAQETQNQTTRAEPERATGWRITTPVSAKHHMIVTANPHASRAGLDILRRGGSAIDAAITAQMVLNLVEPQSSGIGGGAFLLHWDAKNKKVTTYDGRETAPRNARPDRFLKSDGARMKFQDAVFGGLSVGTPGVLRALELAHRKHGRQPWQSLFQPAIDLARNGFKVSPRLNKLLNGKSADSFGPDARLYFFDEFEKARPVGYVLKNPALAKTLQAIANGGVDAFYNPKGDIARGIINKVRQYPNGNKTLIDLKDLALYRAKERPPVCGTYRGYRICGMGPPSSGALTIMQTLKLLEPFNLHPQEVSHAQVLHLIAEAEKLAYADRNLYIADSDFVEVPRGLLDDGYIAARRKLIRVDKTMGKAEPGTPPLTKGSFGKDATIENKGTSHISIIDERGHALSMTTTIESAFGARIMTGGFLLNNELTDFSFLPKDRNDRPIANRVEPGKRPRSSMAPTLVFSPGGKLEMVVGSPGGSRIILYVIKAIIGYIDWRLDARKIANLPNFGSRNGPFEMEPKGSKPYLTYDRSEFSARGHKLRIGPMTSGLNIITRRQDLFIGGTDPRREGLALGD